MRGVECVGAFGMLPSLATLPLARRPVVPTGSGRAMSVPLSDEEQAILDRAIEAQRNVVERHDENDLVHRLPVLQQYRQTMDEVNRILRRNPRLGLRLLAEMAGVVALVQNPAAHNQRKYELLYNGMMRLQMLQPLLELRNQPIYCRYALQLLFGLCFGYVKFVYALADLGVIPMLMQLLGELGTGEEHYAGIIQAASQLLGLIMSIDHTTYRRSRHLSAAERDSLQAASSQIGDLAPLPAYVKQIRDHNGIDVLMQQWEAITAIIQAGNRENGVRTRMRGIMNVITVVIRSGTQQDAIRMGDLGLVRSCAKIAASDWYQVRQDVPLLLHNYNKMLRLKTGVNEDGKEFAPYLDVPVRQFRAQQIYNYALDAVENHLMSHETRNWNILLSDSLPESAHDVIASRDGQAIDILVNAMRRHNTRNDQYQSPAEEIAVVLMKLCKGAPGVAQDKIRATQAIPFLLHVLFEPPEYTGRGHIFLRLVQEYLRHEPTLHAFLQEYPPDLRPQTFRIVDKFAPRANPEQHIAIRDQASFFKYLCGQGVLWNTVKSNFEDVRDLVGPLSPAEPRPLRTYPNPWPHHRQIGWDWDKVSDVLQDYDVLAKAALDNPKPSLPAALMLVLKIEVELQAEEEDKKIEEQEEDKEELQEQEKQKEDKEQKEIDLRRQWMAVLPKLKEVHELNPLWGKVLEANIDRVMDRVMRPDPVRNPWYRGDLAEWGEMMADAKDPSDLDNNDKASRKRVRTTEMALRRFAQLNREHLLLRA